MADAMKKKITTVQVDKDSCLLHECCVDLCPQVFEVHDDIYTAVKGNAHLYFHSRAAQIREAVAACPVAAISIDEEQTPK